MNKNDNIPHEVQAMTWIGWLWNTRKQRWENVCQEDGLGACSRRLGEIADLRGLPCRYATMTGGAVPAVRPAGKKRSEPRPPTA